MKPFGALDAQTRNLLQNELLEIWGKTKKTIIFVTHSVDEAVFLADRLIVLTSRPGSVCEAIPIELPRPATGPDPDSPRSGGRSLTSSPSRDARFNKI